MEARVPLPVGGVGPAGARGSAPRGLRPVSLRPAVPGHGDSLRCGVRVPLGEAQPLCATLAALKPPRPPADVSCCAALRAGGTCFQGTQRGSAPSPGPRGGPLSPLPRRLRGPQAFGLAPACCPRPGHRPAPPPPTRQAPGERGRLHPPECAEGELGAAASATVPFVVPPRPGTGLKPVLRARLHLTCGSETHSRPQGRGSPRDGGDGDGEAERGPGSARVVQEQRFPGGSRQALGIGTGPGRGAPPRHLPRGVR